MTDLVCLEIHQSFADVSERARTLAMQHQQEIIFRHANNAWEILVPLRLIAIFDRISYNDENSYNSDDHYLYDPDDSERKLLTDELMDNQEDWARSEEGGWYYSDDD